MGQPRMAGRTPRSRRWAVLISAGISVPLLLMMVAVIIINRC